MILTCRVRSVAIAVAMVLGGGGTAAAAAAAWSPDVAAQGPWQPTPAAPPDVARVAKETCPVTRSAWLRPAELVTVTATEWTCPETKNSRSYALSLQSTTPGASPGDSAVGEGFAFGWGTDGRTVRGQGWAQGSAVLLLRVDCGALGPDPCSSLARTLAVSWSAARPGDPEPLLGDLVRTAFQLPLVAWIMLVGLPGIVRLLARSRYDVPRGLPAWHDVGPSVRRLKARMIGWGCVVGIRRIALAVLVVQVAGVVLGFGPSTGPTLAFGTGSVLVAALTVPIARRIEHPALPAHRDLPELRRMTPSASKLATGLALRGAARLMMLAAVGFWFLVVMVSSIGGSSSTAADTMVAGLQSRADAGTLGVLDQFRVSVLLLSDDPDLVIMLVFLLAIGAVAVDRFGARLLRPSFDQVHDGRPEIVYLRNFGDDRMTLPASRISRRGLLGRMSPVRRRSFEELVVQRLSAAGSVVGVNPPGRRVERPGVLKTRLPPDGDTWKEVVADLAADALAVAVSATPDSINPGFAWELEHLAARMPHHRLILVLGSRRRGRLLKNWSRFTDHTRRHRLFDGLRAWGFGGATQVLVLVPGQGWSAWGARVRSEWTYAMAMHQALAYAVPGWLEDRRRQRERR